MNPLKYSDFIQKDENTIQELIDQLKELLKTYKEAANAVRKEAEETANSIKHLGSATEEQRAKILTATEAQEKLLQEYKDINSEQRIAKREINFLTQAQKEKAQMDKLIIQQNKSLEGSYNKLSAQYRLLKIEINQMSDAEVRDGKTKKQLEAQAKSLYEQMSKMQKATGKYTLEVGNYQTALNALPPTLSRIGKAFTSWQALAVGAITGVIAGITKLVKMMKDWMQVNAAFEQANANLQAVLGASKKDMQALTETSLALGRSTEWTASQVTSLQMELAKLGFGDASIIAMQKHVLAFATAVGADLGEAANVAGAAIRAFNLTSSDAERVMGTLAVAVNNSALTFDRIKYAMGTVFPIAHAFGLEIEDATALLGALANAGFSAESAATATRNMLLNLADANGKLAQRTGGAAKSFEDIIMKAKQLREEGANLSEIFELTDKRSVAAFNALIDGADVAVALRDRLNEVEGELRRIQQTRLDTVTGQTTILKSYWEGLKLSIRESNGFLKKTIELMQEAVKASNKLFFPEQISKQTALDQYMTDYEDFVSEIKDESTDVQGALDILFNAQQDELKENLADIQKEIDKLGSEGTLTVAGKVQLELLKRQRKELQGELDGMAEAHEIISKRIILDEQERLAQEAQTRAEAAEKEDELSKKQKQQRLKDLQARIDAIKMEIAATEEGDERRLQLYKDLVNAERDLDLEKNRQAEQSAKIEVKIINDKYDKELELAEKKYYKEIAKLTEENLRAQQQAVQLEIAITEDGTQKMLDLRLKNIEIQRQLEIVANRQKDEKIRQDEADINKKYDKLYIDEVKKRVLIIAKREIEAARQIRESNHNMEIHNEREKTIFRLNEEKKRLRAILEMDKLAVDKMTKTEKEAIIKQMQEINVEMERLGYNNIYEVLGISLSPQQQDALNTAFEAVKSNLDSITAKWKESADAAVESANKQVEAAQKILEGEIEARQKGYASREDSARKELEQAKKNQQQALKEQERAKNAQLRLDSLQQASSLTTASANIWKAFSGTGPWGIALAIAGIAAMWTSFISAQIKARQVTQFGEGTVELLEGGSHASGHDIDLGYDSKKRKHRRAEGGEFFAVINKRNSRKYRSVIPDVINSFNDGTFADKYMRASGNMAGMATQIIGGGTDISRLEKDVRAIKEQGDEVRFTDPQGRVIVKYKNLTTIKK